MKMRNMHQKDLTRLNKSYMKSLQDIPKENEVREISIKSHKIACTLMISDLSKPIQL